MIRFLSRLPSLPKLLYQAQAPKLKTDVLEMESALKERCDAAAVGDYTLWNTGPEVALEMLRVSESFQRRCVHIVGVILSSLLRLFSQILLEVAEYALLPQSTVAAELL